MCLTRLDSRYPMLFGIPCFRWFYETIYGAVADFFTMMGSMGADIFDLDWVKATIKLFTLFGWSLFIAGVVVPYSM